MIPELEEKNQQSIKQMIYNACIESRGISCHESSQLVDTIFNEDLETLTSTLLGTMFSTKDEDFIQDVKFNEIWLRVAK